MKLIFILGAVLTMTVHAADQECGKIQIASFGTLTTVRMESGKVYVISGQAAPSAAAIAIANHLEVCVIGIEDTEAIALSIKR